MENRPLVAVTDHLAEAGVETPILQEVADLELLQTVDEMEVVRRARHAAILLVYHDIKLTSKSLGELPNLRAVIRCGVGFDNVDLQAAGQRGIVVCNVPDYGTEEVADHAVMLLLACARRLIPCHDAIRQDRWDLTAAFGTPRLRGRTLGLIGCGRIGTATALRAKALGLRVVFHDPYLPDGIDKALGVERVWNLADLLKQSQFVSLHCPLTPETRHLVNRETLSLMPRGVYLINTARGPVVNLDALHEALESGRVAYAGLDVFEREPLDHDGIRRHPRVILTPHSAFYSVEGSVEMRSKGALEAKRVLLGEPVRNPVNLHFLREPQALVPAGFRAR